MNVLLYGMTFSHSLFLMMILSSSTVPQMSIFSVPSSHLKTITKKLEIIDGQQRLTTIMLLLRAFYDKFANMKDRQSVKTREAIEGCVWKTDEFGDLI